MSISCSLGHASVRGIAAIERHADGRREGSTDTLARHRAARAGAARPRIVARRIAGRDHTWGIPAAGICSTHTTSVSKSPRQPIGWPRSVVFWTITLRIGDTDQRWRNFSARSPARLGRLPGPLHFLGSPIVRLRPAPLQLHGSAERRAILAISCAKRRIDAVPQHR